MCILCVFYNNCRASLLSDLKCIVFSTLSHTVGSGVSDKIPSAELIDLIIHGTGYDDKDRELFASISRYMKGSGRFHSLV